MFQIKGLLFNGGYYDAVPEGMEGIVYFDVFLGLDVKLKNDKWIFVWDEVEQVATRLSCRDMKLVKFRWDGDATDCYFELKINEDALTGDVTLVITDFAEEGDVEDAKLLWEEQVRMLGLHLGIRL